VKKRLFIGSAVLAFVVACSALVILLRKEPGYQGKSIKSWALQALAPQQEARQEAIAAFQQMGPKAVPQLAKLLERKDSLLRRTAWSLALNLPSGPRQRMVKKLQPLEAERVHIAAALSLESFGPEAEKAVPALARVLVRDKALVRGYAASALGRIGGPAIPELLAAMSNKDTNVAYAAASGLEQAGTNALAAAPGLMMFFSSNDELRRNLATGLLPKLGPRVLPFLKEAAANPDPSMRMRVAGLFPLVHAPREQIVPPLLLMLKDKDAGCREKAVAALGFFQLPNRTILEGLLAATNDPKTSVRVAAIKTLGKPSLDTAHVVCVLSECLNDESPAIRTEAARSLGSLGPAAQSALPDLIRLGGANQDLVSLAARDAAAKIDRGKGANGQH